MGITCRLIGGPDQTIEGLLREPDSFDYWEDPDGPSGYMTRPGFVARLFGAKPEWKPFYRTDIGFPPSKDDDKLDLDKSWHVLHYIISGRADDPGDLRGFLMYSGLEILQRDFPVRAFYHRDIVEISKYLELITENIARERFVWKRMMEEEVYPEIQCKDDFPEELFTHYWAHFGHLREYIESLRVRGYGVVIAYG